jgi:LacI family transcriptional regulator
VSATTVSRFLNENGYVSREAAERVKRAMAQLDYHPSKFARGLAGKQPDGIGVVAQNFADPFFGMVLRGIEQIIKAHNLQLTVAAGNRQLDDEDKAIRFLRQQHYTVVVLTTSVLPGARLLDLLEDGLDIVHIGQFIPEISERCIYLDDAKGAELATKYLVAQGHTRIAHLSLPKYQGDHPDTRSLGYRCALERAGLSYLEALVVEPGGFDEMSALQAVNRLLRRGERFTALFASTDLLALGAYKALRQAGLSIPGDVSVIGFDDIDLASFLYPTLTTIRQPIQEMSRAAAHLAIQYLKGRQEEVVRQFSPMLIERDSVRKL